MKIKCLLESTFESNDDSSVFRRQEDEVQLAPGESHLWGADSNSPRRGELAASQGCDRGAQSSSDPPSAVLHLHFFLLSDKLEFLPPAFLAMNQVTRWSQQEFPGCFSNSWEGAAQTQLKKHSLKNFNLLDLSQFVLNRLKSTPSILLKFEIPWTRVFLWCTIILNQFWFIAVSKILKTHDCFKDSVKYHT